MDQDRAPDVRFVVPGPPKALERNRHRIVRKKDGGQFVANYLPAQSRAEQNAVRMFAAQAMAGRPPFEGPLEMRMTAFLPIPPSWSRKKQAAALAGTILPAGRPDVDNLVKLVLDGAQQIAMREDSQIVSMHVWKRYSDTPRVCVELRRLGITVPLATPARQSPLVGVIQS